MDPRLRVADLAPGDRAVAARNWSDLRVRAVSGPADPDFEAAFGTLWAEFGARGEMERRAVIADRLRWDPARPDGGAARCYELLVLRVGEAIAAVRDHTAVVRLDAAGAPLPGPTVVHLSHAFVDPAQRGGGLAAWLRALPLGAARRCARAAGRAPGAPEILAAEMEHRDSTDAACMTRLRSYERAGFRKLDPAEAPYSQPDFGAGGSPAGALPLALVVRRVGAEDEDTIPAAEVAAVVQAIYAVYAAHVPPAALDPLRAAARAWTARRPRFRLLPPTA